MNDTGRATATKFVAFFDNENVLAGPNLERFYTQFFAAFQSEDSATPRNATPDDVDGIAALDLACFGPEKAWCRDHIYEYTIESMAREAGDPDADDCHVVVVEEGEGNIIAAGMYQDGYLDSLCVSPPERHKGHGRRVLLALIPPGTPTTLQVAEGSDAVSFYEKFGFVATGEVLPDYCGAARPARVMWFAGMKPKPERRECFHPS